MAGRLPRDVCPMKRRGERRAGPGAWHAEARQQPRGMKTKDNSVASTSPMGRPSAMSACGWGRVHIRPQPVRGFEDEIKGECDPGNQLWTEHAVKADHHRLATWGAPTRAGLPIFESVGAGLDGPRQHATGRALTDTVPGRASGGRRGRRSVRNAGPARLTAPIRAMRPGHPLPTGHSPHITTWPATPARCTRRAASEAPRLISAEMGPPGRPGRPARETSAQRHATPRSTCFRLQ